MDQKQGSQEDDEPDLQFEAREFGEHTPVESRRDVFLGELGRFGRSDVMDDPKAREELLDRSHAGRRPKRRRPWNT